MENFFQEDLNKRKKGSIGSIKKEKENQNLLKK